MRNTDSIRGDINADPLSPKFLGGYACSSTSAEGVKDDVSLVATCFYDAL